MMVLTAAIQVMLALATFANAVCIVICIRKQTELTWRQNMIDREVGNFISTILRTRLHEPGIQSVAEDTKMAE